mmetsp:Transcript_25467/g.49918  ORF Transcript_25467/g.49918 Transcript_25467/m.49918 type:complete len:751 (+) Transcript_25467:65-2317(+)
MCRCLCGDPHEDDDHDPQKAEGTAGPVINRRCTDLIWLFIFLVYCAIFSFCSYMVMAASNPQELWHGVDHNKEPCDNKIYFPKLYKDFTDLIKDPYMQNLYGVCVNACPKQGDMVEDWFVPLPTLAIANRCIPYQHTATANGTTMCAWPRCELIKSENLPKTPRQVCGLKLDKTDNYWLVEKPDTWLQMGWRNEGVSDGVIQSRVSIMKEKGEAAKQTCEVLVHRGMTTMLEDRSASIVNKLVSKYTGYAFRQAQVLFNNLAWVLGLGLGGSLVLCLIIIMFVPCCVKLVMAVLMCSLFAALLLADYILFVQADIVPNTTGKAIHDLLEDVGVPDALEKGLDALGVMANVTSVTDKMLRAQEDAEMQKWYQWAAIGLAIGICLLFCIVIALRHNFKVLAALLEVASQTLREMPSLLLFPFLNLISLACWLVLLLYVLLGTLALDNSVAMRWLEKMGVQNLGLQDVKNAKFAKRGFMWTTLFSFLWIYFYHIAAFQTTIAGAVAHWYFYRLDPEHSAGTGIHSKGWFFGRPLVYAYCRVVRYHMGSLALGSLILALVTLPRIILEYLDQQSKRASENNPVVQLAFRAIRCCLWCFDQCLKWLTTYSYINIAVSGRPFCKAAHKSFVILAKYPVQVTLDYLASTVLQAVVGLLVPLCMVMAAYFKMGSWVVCGVAVALLAYMVTRMAVGVYDICISALFVCAIDDAEKHGGKYAPDELRQAFGFSARRLTIDVELSSTSPPHWRSGGGGDTS